MPHFSFRKMTIVGMAAILLCHVSATDLTGTLFEPKIQNVCWSLGKNIDEARARWGLDIAKEEGVHSVRLYDSMPTPQRFLHLANEHGLRVIMGAWLDTNRQENTEQLTMLRNAINSQLVEPIAIVGSEALLYKRMSLEDLLGYIEETKRELPEHVAVTTAEAFEVLIKNPRLIDAQRHVVGMHYYPYAHGVPINDALHDLAQHYEQIKALSGNKKVVVFETGWPSDGNPVGNAVPSVENQKKYNRQVAAWAQKNNVEVYLFQLIDEPWKVQFIENTYEAHWGMRREDGSPK